MLTNYLRVALRMLAKRRGLSFINVFGLAVGMACAILIFLSVRQDLAFDGFHEKADRVFRVVTLDQALGVSSQRVGITIPALGPALAAELPEVEAAVRMSGGDQQLLSYGERDLYAPSTFLAEPAVFEVFDFPLVAGDARTALAEPATVVLTETMARRVFGEEDPVGKTIRLNHDQDVRVTGVMADLPATSSLQFDMLESIFPPEGEDTQGWRDWLASWQSISMTTYVLLREPDAAEALVPQMNALLRANDTPDPWSVTLQPLGDVHLGSSDVLFDDSVGQRDRGYVVGLAAVAVFVLLIACFNFMNLATAQAADRAREVGLRKTLGATRAQLVRQHLGESLLLSLVSFVLALGLVAAALPFAGEALGRQMSLGLLADPLLLLLLLVLAIVVGLLAGSYPAFVLSKFQPSAVLRGAFRRSPRGVSLRRALVVTQFVASVVMIVGALIVSSQLDFIMNRNVGYQRDQVLVLELDSEGLQANGTALTAALRQNPAVVGVTASSTVPGRQLGRTGLTPEGAPQDDDNPWIVSVLAIDDQFVPTMGMEMAGGRNFSRAFGTDTTEAVLINEAAARSFGWTDPVGKTVQLGEDDERTVVGVVRDFHFASVRHQVEPLLMLYEPEGSGLLSLKLQADDLPQTLAFVEATWERVNPGYPFDYQFLDDEFADLYREEASFSALARGFTVLAIVIACLGLLGLAAFTAEQRTKEVGVRKVLGASTAGLVALLSKDFLVLVGVAFVIAAPLAWFVMSRWLEGFAYRVALGPGVFLLAGVLALGVALLTVASQALRAASTDPVKALRYE